LGYSAGSLPATEAACQEVLSLPVFPELTADEQSTVIDAIEAFCCQAVASAA
jgi:dTDP-4-amino-4,6-dideoxygalactose transaminase